MSTSRTVTEIINTEKIKILLAMSGVDLTSQPLKKDNIETYKTLVEIYNCLQERLDFSDNAKINENDIQQ